MINSLNIENFRGFQKLSLSGLARINVVVGKNASGKTALLEAIRVGLAGTPQVLWQVNQARLAGIPIQMGPSREQFENVWRSDFFNLDSSRTISFDFCDTSGQTAKLRIFYDTSNPVTSIPDQPTTPPSTVSPLVFDRTDFAGRKSRISASIGVQGNFQMDQGAEMGVVSEFHTSYNSINPQQNANFFSALSIANKEKEIVEAMREEFGPLIQDLTVLSPQGYPSLYVVAAGFQDKVPISLLSSGVNKLFAMLAAMIVRSNGVLLIDEIDNGFYYDRLESIWRILHRLSVKYNTQIFASTHSSECLRALSSIIREHESDFALLRAERDETGSHLKLVDGSLLESAIENNFEVR